MHLQILIEPQIWRDSPPISESPVLVEEILMKLYFKIMFDVRFYSIAIQNYLNIRRVRLS